MAITTNCHKFTQSNKIHYQVAILHLFFFLFGLQKRPLLHPIIVLKDLANTPVVFALS